MQVVPSNFTIAEYCGQMKEGKITVNREYQRSNQVWPPRAKSYLIETILLGYPIPKLSLYQQLDVRRRLTIKEIVDGQQRSQTILSFFEDNMRISGKSEFAGKRLSQLDEDVQARFLEYRLSVDTFVGATAVEIREVFRRINSYNIPLNKQETRHSTFQGDFKWYMVDLSRKYSQILKDLGVYSESSLNRMSDAVLLTEIIMALHEGIISASESKIDKFYKEHDHEGTFPQGNEITGKIEEAFNYIIKWQDLHGTVILKPYNMHCLILAIIHCRHVEPSLSKLFPLAEPIVFNEEIAVTNLTTLAAAVENPDAYKQFSDFIIACSEATNRLVPRETRFQYFCKALQPTIM